MRCPGGRAGPPGVSGAPTWNAAWDGSVEAQGDGRTPGPRHQRPHLVVGHAGEWSFLRSSWEHQDERREYIV